MAIWRPGRVLPQFIHHVTYEHLLDSSDAYYVLHNRDTYEFINWHARVHGKPLSCMALQAECAEYFEQQAFCNLCKHFRSLVGDVAANCTIYP
jgi:hypothetical protein